jgi:hypothetical protein
VDISDLEAQKGKLSALKTLEFRNVRGNMQRLSGLPITNLDLSYSELSGGFFDRVVFPELRCLRLSDCTGINPNFIHSLSQFPQLMQLEIDGCELNDEEILRLNAPFLEHLNLDDNPDLTNKALPVAAQCRNLTNLMFGGWAIDDQGLESIPHLPLRELSIRETVITSEGLSNLEKAKSSLETLSLQTCRKIEAAGLLIFRQLKTLRLRDTHVRDDEMQDLAKLPRLKTLKLSYIYDYTPAGFERLAESSSIQDIITFGLCTLEKLSSVDPKQVCVSCINVTLFSGPSEKPLYKFLPRKST